MSDDNIWRIYEYDGPYGFSGVVRKMEKKSLLSFEALNSRAERWGSLIFGYRRMESILFFFLVIMGKTGRKLSEINLWTICVANFPCRLRRRSARGDILMSLQTCSEGILYAPTESSGDPSI